MSFQASSLRVAGQDSDIVDIIFPSSEVSRCLLVSSVPGKQMYGNNESIKSWIDAINRVSLIPPLSIVVADRLAGQQIYP